MKVLIGDCTSDGVVNPKTDVGGESEALLAVVSIDGVV